MTHVDHEDTYTVDRDGAPGHVSVDPATARPGRPARPSRGHPAAADVDDLTPLMPPAGRAGSPRGGRARPAEPEPENHYGLVGGTTAATMLIGGGIVAFKLLSGVVLLVSGAGAVLVTAAGVAAYRVRQRGRASAASGGSPRRRGGLLPGNRAGGGGATGGRPSRRRSAGGGGGLPSLGGSNRRTRKPGGSALGLGSPAGNRSRSGRPAGARKALGALNPFRGNSGGRHRAPGNSIFGPSRRTGATPTSRRSTLTGLPPGRGSNRHTRNQPPAATNRRGGTRGGATSTTGAEPSRFRRRYGNTNANLPRTPMAAGRWARNMGPAARAQAQRDLTGAAGVTPRRQRMLNRAIDRASQRAARRAGPQTGRRTRIARASLGVATVTSSATAIVMAGLLANPLTWIVLAVVAASAPFADRRARAAAGRLIGRTARWVRFRFGEPEVITPEPVRVVPKPAPQPAAQPKPDPDTIDADVDSDYGVRPADVPKPSQDTKPEDVPTTEPEREAVRGFLLKRRRRHQRRPTTTTTASTVATGGLMHPHQQKIAAASFAYTANYSPRSIPDLHRYLESQGEALSAEARHYRQLIRNLAASFPAAVFLAEPYSVLAEGLKRQEFRAQQLFEAYTVLNGSDVDRHKRPLPNQELLDVAAGAHGGSLPTIAGGSVMHENHALMVATTRVYVAGYEPGQVLNDRLLDLEMYVTGQEALFMRRAEHLVTLSNRLLNLDRVKAGVGDFYRAFAAGYADCADLSRAVAARFELVYQFELVRRRKPRVQEEWHDKANA